MRSFVRRESSWVPKKYLLLASQQGTSLLRLLNSSILRYLKLQCYAQQNRQEVCTCARWLKLRRKSTVHIRQTSGREKRIGLSEQHLKQEIVEADETVQEKTLEATNKTTLHNVLDRLKPTSETQHTSSGSISVNTKIQSLITKLIELGLSSSKLEWSRILLQAFFKNSKLSLDEQLDILLEGRATQENLITFLSNLQVPNKKLSGCVWNILSSLQVSKHIKANVKGKDFAQQFPTVPWIDSFWMLLTLAGRMC